MMRRVLSALGIFGLVLAPVMGRPGGDSRAAAYARSAERTEVVGRIVNSSSKLLDRRVQVRAGGEEWTLNVPSGTPVRAGRREVSVHDLDVGTYVRAIGRRIGRTRLRTDHVYVIGDRLALRRSGYARRNGEAGYVISTAGYRSR